MSDEPKGKLRLVLQGTQDNMISGHVNVTSWRFFVDGLGQIFTAYHLISKGWSKPEFRDQDSFRKPARWKRAWAGGLVEYKNTTSFEEACLIWAAENPDDVGS
jgi:hypothetical protein